MHCKTSPLTSLKCLPPVVCIQTVTSESLISKLCFVGSQFKVVLVVENNEFHCIFMHVYGIVCLHLSALYFLYPQLPFCFNNVDFCLILAFLSFSHLT